MEGRRLHSFATVGSHLLTSLPCRMEPSHHYGAARPCRGRRRPSSLSLRSLSGGVRPAVLGPSSLSLWLCECDRPLRYIRPFPQPSIHASPFHPLPLAHTAHSLTLSLSFSLVRVSCLARLDPDPMARARSTSQSVNRGRPSRRPEQQICDAFPRNNNLHSSCKLSLNLTFRYSHFTTQEASHQEQRTTHE